jgi:DNA repair exonuclease SbcCD ATPase subunit
MELFERLNKLQTNVLRLKTYKDILKSRADSLSLDIEKSQKRVNLLQQSTDVFKGWLDDSIQKNVESISDLVTIGLRHVIYDQNLTFKISQEVKANRLSMKFIIEDDGVEGDPLLSFGGGTVLTASLILRVAIMSRLNMCNLLLLDESMHALANKYVPLAASFMKQLSEQTGINILMVTHNDEFFGHADTAYEGHKDGSLKLHKR